MQWRPLCEMNSEGNFGPEVPGFFSTSAAEKQKSPTGDVCDCNRKRPPLQPLFPPDAQWRSAQRCQDHNKTGPAGATQHTHTRSSFVPVEKVHEETRNTCDEIKRNVVMEIFGQNGLYHRNAGFIYAAKTDAFTAKFIQCSGV